MEFASILDDLPSVPTPLITKRMVRALHLESLEQRFAEFEVMPLSAASIAQVHRARLLDGTRVVVKVMRPGIEKRFRVDLAIAGTCARLLAWHQAFRRMGIRALANELHQLTCEELDFTREVRNFRQLRQRMLDDDIDHYCPVVYPELSALTVITMEEIVGVSVKTLMQASSAARGTPADRRSADRPERLAAIAQLAQWAHSASPERTARLLVRSFLEQAMRHRLFRRSARGEYDRHEGRYVGGIDLGMIGWLDEAPVGNMNSGCAEAIAEGLLDAAYRHLLATVEPPPRRSRSSRRNSRRILRDWLARRWSSPVRSLDASGVERRAIFTCSRKPWRGASCGLRLPRRWYGFIAPSSSGTWSCRSWTRSVNRQSLIRDFVADERLDRPSIFANVDRVWSTPARRSNWRWRGRTSSSTREAFQETGVVGERANAIHQPVGPGRYGG
ncbi:MAG: AarF/ABC1/UbiB kinase family protein [Gemmatimonadaceae bacterium]|nr:AarF/ABC1/UbiB kinase family protein [Gemmatimonadaceae bacterium]